MEQNWYREVFLCQKSLINLGEVVSSGFLNFRVVILKEIAVFFRYSLWILLCAKEDTKDGQEFKSKRTRQGNCAKKGW